MLAEEFPDATEYVVDNIDLNDVNRLLYINNVLHESVDPVLVTAGRHASAGDARACGVCFN